MNHPICAACGRSHVGAKQFPSREVAEFNRAFDRVMSMSSALRDAMTERESLFFQMGLRSSHVEEAMTIGDTERANAHFKKLIELLRQVER